MGVRTASASAMVVALALTLLAPAAAQAAPAPITPRYASSAQAPGGSWAGLAPLDASSTGRTDRPLGSGTSLDLRVREPAGSTGRVLDASLSGIVTLDVTQLTAGTAGSTGSVLTSWAGAPTGEPTGWPGTNDRLTSSFSIDQPLTTWAFRYTFDFSGLAGGVLPAGSRIVAADVDVCQDATAGGVDERFTATSSAVGPWLDYEYRIVRSGMQTPTPTVTYDPDANAYGVAPQCADRDMIEAFVTTQPMSSLTIELANRQGSGLTRFGLLLPTSAPTPALTLATTTQGQDVDAEPGPRIPVGDDVDQAFTVTNAGDVALADVTVTDDAVDAAAIDCGDGTNVVATLAVGAEATCTATSVAAEGQQQRTATTTGTAVDSNGEPIAGAPAPSAQDASWYVGVADPAASLATTASGSEAAPGESVTFTTTIENTGVTAVDGGTVEAVVPVGIDVTDSGGGTIVDGPDGDVVRWPIAPIAAGETATATLTGTVLPADPGAVVELRTTGTAVAGGTVFALDPVEPCVDDVAAACAVVTVAAAPASTPPPTAPPSTPPPSAAPGQGALPATGATLAPAAWIVAMVTLLTGLGLVLGRRRIH